jgi:hypothetical protein
MGSAMDHIYCPILAMALATSGCRASWQSSLKMPARSNIVRGPSRRWVTNTCTERVCKLERQYSQNISTRLDQVLDNVRGTSQTTRKGFAQPCIRNEISIIAGTRRGRGELTIHHTCRHRPCGRPAQTLALFSVLPTDGMDPHRTAPTCADVLCTVVMSHLFIT